MNIKNALKHKIINGRIEEQAALAVGEQADQLISEAVAMLDRCRKQVGMFMGGEIAELTAKIKGEKFSEKDFFHERLPDGQE